MWENELWLSQAQNNSVAQLTETAMSKEVAGSALQGQEPRAPWVHWIPSVNSFSVADAVSAAFTRWLYFHGALFLY